MTCCAERTIRQSLVDAAFRCAYRCAYRALRLYWRLFHPETHGALVALWHADELLLVRNSYVDLYGLPGGYVRKRETAAEAAVRELAEELALRVFSRELVLVHEETYEWAGKRDHVTIFRLDLDAPPAICVDRREVVSAEFHTTAAALALPLIPPLRRYLEACRQAASPASAATVPRSDL